MFREVRRSGPYSTASSRNLNRAATNCRYSLLAGFSRPGSCPKQPCRAVGTLLRGRASSLGREANLPSRWNPQTAGAHGSMAQVSRATTTASPGSRGSPAADQRHVVRCAFDLPHSAAGPARAAKSNSATLGWQSCSGAPHQTSPERALRRQRCNHPQTGLQPQLRGECPQEAGFALAFRPWPQWVKDKNPKAPAVTAEGRGGFDLRPAPRSYRSRCLSGRAWYTATCSRILERTLHRLPDPGSVPPSRGFSSEPARATGLERSRHSAVI